MRVNTGYNSISWRSHSTVLQYYVVQYLRRCGFMFASGTVPATIPRTASLDIMNREHVACCKLQHSSAVELHTRVCSTISCPPHSRVVFRAKRLENLYDCRCQPSLWKSLNG